jgi:hypothetical protein
MRVGARLRAFTRVDVPGGPFQVFNAHIHDATLAHNDFFDGMRSPVLLRQSGA